MSLVSLIKSVNKGWLKDVLVGAGLTLGTSAVTLTGLNAAVSFFKGSVNGLPIELLGLAHVAGFDAGFSIVLGAYVARAVQNAGSLTLKKIAK